jgi:flagellar hook assembly protein FlgD
MGYHSGVGFMTIKTTNAGVNWFEQTIGTTNIIFNSISFTNVDNGTIVGDGGIILNTTDGGNTWIQQNSITTYDFNKVCFTNPENGFVIGENGTIISTSQPGVVPVEQGNEVELTPKDFSLSQNYPNPFNPSTKIKFEIPGQARNDNVVVTLIVYDILGREVATLVNEEKPAGEYEVEFDGNRLPSGIYFYQLKAGQFSETRKMILLR